MERSEPPHGSIPLITAAESAGFVSFSFAARVAHDARGDARGVFYELESFLGPEDADDLGEAVGGNAFGSDYRNEAVICQADASPRIDDVRVAFAMHFEALI